MMDTVILTIPRGQFRLDPAAFTPNANLLKQSGNFLLKCVSNPTAHDKSEGKYKPRLTLVKRPTKNGSEIPLKIEFSVAKMLYGNNVEEVTEKDFERVVVALRKAMLEMTVDVSLENLMNAKVSTFHPSKNIKLRNGYTSSFVINELSKVNVTKKLDLNRDSFRNNGHSLQYYANSHSFVIYDKLQDLKKPEKRAIDKDQNSIQLSLFDALVKKKHTEILRLEVRLCKRVKMNSVLKALGFKENPTFREIFKKDVCQKILQMYWAEMVESKQLFLFDVDQCPKKTLRALFKSNASISPKEAIYLVGLRVLSKEGIRDVRAVVEKHSSPRTWYRMAQDLKTLDRIGSKSYHTWVKQVADCLHIFAPFRLSTKRPLLCKQK